MATPVGRRMLVGAMAVAAAMGAVGVVGAVALEVPRVSAASAQGGDADAEGWLNPDGGGVGVGTPGSGTGSDGDGNGGGQSRPRTCRYLLQDSGSATPGAPIAAGQEVTLAELRETITEPTPVWRVCTWLDTGEAELPELIVVEPDPAALALAAARRAAAELVLPLPTPSTSPPGRTVVNVATWAWTDATGPLQRSASVGPVTATVTARPSRVVWRPGDGATVTCGGAGHPYRPAVTTASAAGDACVHTIRTVAGTLEGRIDQVWHLSWSATNGESGVLGEVARTASVPLEVVELQAVLRRP